MLYQVPCSIIGKVGGKELEIFKGGKKLVGLPVSKLSDSYYSAIPDRLAGKK